MNLCNNCKKKSIIGGSMLTRYICPHCFNECMSPSTFLPRLCTICSDKLNRCQMCCNKIENDN